MQPILYVAITNHGFGHATRAASIAATIQTLCPEILIILVTTAPRWLLESYMSGDFIHRPRGFDIGVVQPNSLMTDKVATLEKLQHLRSQQDRLIASEVTFIQQNRVGLVLADIPPMAALIAKAAGIPCWMVGNFGWDFIYRDWGEEFSEVADWVAACFGHCQQLFRLPLHEPMSAFPAITDVGFTGGSPRYSEAELRESFGLHAPRDRTVLLTFGGLGVESLPYANLARFPDWQFMTFDANAPDLPNLCKATTAHYRPVDFMPLCGRVVSKPGYSTFSEALRMDTPIVSVTRNDFAEAPILLDGIRNLAQHQILSSAELFESDWEWLHQPLQLPQQPQAIDKDGNGAIAQAVVNFFQRA